jgi:hypothetical protein
LDKIPEIGVDNIVFMIGLLIVRNGPSQGPSSQIYKSFIVNELNQQSEKKIFEDLISCIRQESGNEVFNVYHWGHIEKSTYNNICSKYGLLFPLQFCDLCSVFREEPILFKGVFNFSLKSITGYLINEGLIDNNDHYNISGGLEAMITAYNCYLQCSRNFEQGPEQGPCQVTSDPNMKKIIDYNRLDCLFMWKIINFLRTKI